ncbi:MAG: DUF3108 domain-containing protein [Burkholderiaceae bacterium]
MPERTGFSATRSLPASKRWVAILLTSLFLHGLTIEWANGNLVFPLRATPAESLMTAHLQSVAPGKAPPLPAAIPKQARPKPKARTAKIRSAPATAPAPTVVPEAAAAAFPAEARQENQDIPGSDSAVDIPTASTESEPIPEVAASTAQTNLPPSAELKYEVQAHKKGLSYYGTGTIQWHTDGSRYAILGKAKAAFFTVLEFKSEGEIDQAGIAPVLYAERAGNRAETNTHFHRERNTISFSASTLSYPRVGGEQDRASIIWQLAAMGRAHPELFKPGEDLSIFVAGVRNAAPWRIYIIGEEDVQLDTGTVKGWHVRSVPQQGGYEKTFDIWYASGYEWYPVKLRQTEVGGDYLELTLSNLMLAQH